MILRRPWLAIANTYVGYQSRNMVISNGEVVKNIILYPLVEASSSNPEFTLIQKPLPVKGVQPEENKLDKFLLLVRPSILRMKWKMMPLVILSATPTSFLIQPVSY